MARRADLALSKHIVFFRSAFDLRIHLHHFFMNIGKVNFFFYGIMMSYMEIFRLELFSENSFMSTHQE